jgi:hypothetical protein
MRGRRGRELARQPFDGKCVTEQGVIGVLFSETPAERVEVDEHDVVVATLE